MEKNSTYIVVKDHLVSGEVFQVKKTNINGILKTTPVPEQQNIGKYYQSNSYISHTDSNDNFIDKIYQIVKRYSIKNKYKTILKYHKKPKNLLDIGSGTGDFLSASKQYNISSIGTEPNEQARNLSLKKGNTVVKQIEDIQNRKFDVITLWHVLEHVYHPTEYIKQIKDRLDDNGILLIAVPNYKSYDSAYYKNNWAAYDVPRHLWHFSRVGIKSLVEKESLEIINYKPLLFDSFYVSILSEQNRTGSKNIIKAFIIGLISNLKALFTNEYSSIIYLVKKNTD